MSSSAGLDGIEAVIRIDIATMLVVMIERKFISGGSLTFIKIERDQQPCCYT